MTIPKIGETISPQQFNQLYPIGTKISADEFNKRYPLVDVNLQKDDELLTSPLALTAKVLTSMPSSTWNFAKNLVNNLNPLTTVKTTTALGEELGYAREEMGNWGKVAKETLKEIPGTLWKIVPKFIKEMVEGNYVEAGNTIAKDPVGQIGPILLLTKYGFDKIGKGAQFDAAISTLAKPITYPISKLESVIKTAGTATVGVTTGMGKQSATEALKATPEFYATMRGKISPSTVVNSAINAIRNLKNFRTRQYQSELATLPKEKIIDYSTIKAELYNQLSKFKISVNKKGKLDFSNSPIRNDVGAINDIKTIFEDILAQKDLSPIGLDTLKQNIGLLYSKTARSRSFISAMENVVSAEIKSQVPEYIKLTKSYQETSNLLNEMEGLISSNAKPTTIFTKLNSAMKGSDDLKQMILQEFQQWGQTNLTGTLAGFQAKPLLSGYLRAAIAAGGAWIGGLQLTDLIFMAAVSPRIMGEFLGLLGITGQKASAFLKILEGYKTLLPLGAISNFESNIK